MGQVHDWRAYWSVWDRTDLLLFGSSSGLDAVWCFGERFIVQFSRNLSVLPLFAAVLPVIFVFCGLVLDCGLLQVAKSQMQSAADGAALGAELEAERGTGFWVAAGKQDASVNGYTDGVNNTTVAVQLRSTTGAYTNSYDAIQVTITQQVHSTFMGAFSGGAVTVAAQGVALIPPCMYTLGTSLYAQTHNAMLLQSTQVTGTCPQYVGGNLSVDALSALTAGAVNVTGALAGSLLSGLIPTAPRFASNGIADPLASLTSPAYSGICNYLAFTVTSLPATLYPGTYCGGMTLISASVTLSPGLYVITGGAHWTGSTVRGTGVTLFFTHGGLFGYGQFVMGGGTVVNLSAPVDATGGGVPTVLVFGDRNWAATSPYDFQCTGSTVYGDGIWYTSGTGMSATACSMGAPNYFGIVTDALAATLFSQIRPASNYSNIPGGGPFHGLGGMVQ